MERMNKEIFLEELRGCLRVLEDQEQEDILEEYAQHIDMKMQKGLSEEEAISDFGPIKELASEILEAYHVKPEFQGGEATLRLPGLNNKSAGGKAFFARAWRTLKEKFASMGKGICHVCRQAAGKCRAFGNWIAKPFRKRKEEKALFQEEGMEALGEKNYPAGISLLEEKDGGGQQGEKAGGTKKMRKFFQTVGHGLAALWRRFISFCIFFLRFCWNVLWLMFSLICAFAGVILLMGLGAMVVFLVKGYPVCGLFLMCIGGLLCFVALSAGALSLMVRKKGQEG